LFKVIQGHRNWYQSKANMRLPRDASDNFFSSLRIKLLGSRVSRMWPTLGLQYASCCEQCSSAVTIIVVTIFIATFQNYRIVFLSRYFLCVQNDIFARHLLCKHDRFTTSLLKFQHAGVTLQSRDANDVTRDCRPATVSEQRLRP